MEFVEVEYALRKGPSRYCGAMCVAPYDHVVDNKHTQDVAPSAFGEVGPQVKTETGRV